MGITWMAINRWTDKDDVVYIYAYICIYMNSLPAELPGKPYIYIYIYTYIFQYGILLSHKKNEILPFATTWMTTESIMLSEISQTEKDKYCMISLICRI